jgi:gamma-glutamylcyclotransferase (GGCT)/AIG2-like uncharacterized protein YtfP
MNVFIYGTFMPGETRWGLIASVVKKVSPSYIKGNLYDLGAFPAAVPGKHGKVLGLNIKVPKSFLSYMDSLEGVNPKDHNRGLYRREELPVYSMKGKLVGTSWVYYMSEPQIQNYHGKLIPSGCWKQKE